MQQVCDVLAAWPDVTVLSSRDQRELLLSGVVGRARQQLGLFRALLVLISGIILTLILYTSILDKLHDIARLQLIGASNAMLIGMILQHALILSAAAHAAGYALGRVVFPYLPRRVNQTAGAAGFLSPTGQRTPRAILDFGPGVAPGAAIARAPASSAVSTTAAAGMNDPAEG